LVWDTRIGYPNEHLGKSVIEEVKSPMYATSVYLRDSKRSGRQRPDILIHANGTGKKGLKYDINPKDIIDKIAGRLKGILSDDIGDDQIGLDWEIAGFAATSHLNRNP
jgi:cell division protein FtsA